jgi:nucleoside-diphosphate-sugar epimerase
MSHPIVILGSGYTGRYLASALSKGSRRYFASSREPANHLPHVPQTQRIQFDLGQQETWKNIPEEADLLWCFPAAPRDLVRQFAATWKAPPRRIVVLGSTSAYDIGGSDEYPPPWIDETAPIDLTKPRVQGEEYLRTKLGAIVLRVAGIYGAGRNPLDWIRQGRVGPSRKYVNLIHVEDLAAICLAMLEKGTPGEVYNISDGTPRTWEDICRTVQTRWGIAAKGRRKEDETGKRISTRKLVHNLQPRLQHSDLYANLQTLI